MMSRNAVCVNLATTTTTMMGVTDSFSPSVMDDPRTPLFPVCNSLDQELQYNNNHSTMLRHETTTLKTVNSSAQASSDAEIELPADLFNILENIPFDLDNFDELMALENTYNHLPLQTFDSDSEQIRASISGLATDQLETPTFEELPQVALEPTSFIEDNTILDFDSFPSTTFLSPESPFTNTQPISLDLDLSIQPTIGQDLTTPVIIKMLLDNVDESDNLQTSSPHQQEETEDSMLSEKEGPSTPVPNRRSVSRSSNTSNSDLRRIRNNESSRLSRFNRRKKFEAQTKMVHQLEESNQLLRIRVKELEDLKALFMQHMTENKAKSTSSNN